MTKYIHSQGYKLVLCAHAVDHRHQDPTRPKEAGLWRRQGCRPPRTTTSSPTDQHLFVKDAHGDPYVGRWWKGLGSMIDFTYPKAKQWWQDEVRLAIVLGADPASKDDDGEGNFFRRRRSSSPTAPTRTSCATATPCSVQQRLRPEKS